MGHRKAFVAIVVMMSITLVACGQSKAELTKAEAKNIAIAMASATISGPDAEMKGQQIHQILGEAELTLPEVPLEQADMDNHVRQAYERDARKTLVQLRNLKSSPEQAAKIYAQLADELKSARKSFADLGTTELVTRQHISRNNVEHMKINGLQPTVAQYQAAGLTVPTIVRTRTVIRRVPAPAPRSARATKPAPKKPATKPRRNGEL